MSRLCRASSLAVVVLSLVATTARADAPRRESIVGFSFDLGMPDVIGVGVVVRPLHWLRLSAGGSTALFSGGLGGGVSFVPLRRKLSPSFSVAAGHVFASDVNGVPRAFGINITDQRVGYDYASLHAGVAWAPIRRVSLSLEAGVSFINLTAVPDGDKPSFENATLRVWTPSGRLGVTVFL